MINLGGGRTLDIDLRTICRSQGLRQQWRRAHRDEFYVLWPYSHVPSVHAAQVVSLGAGLEEKQKKPQTLASSSSGARKAAVPNAERSTISKAAATNKAPGATSSAAGGSHQANLAQAASTLLTPRVLRQLLLGSVQVLIAACAGAVLLPVLSQCSNLHPPVGDALSDLQRKLFMAVIGDSSHGPGPLAQFVEGLLRGPLCLPVLWTASFASLAVVRGCYVGLYWGLARLYALLKTPFSSRK